MISHKPRQHDIVMMIVNAYAVLLAGDLWISSQVQRLSGISAILAEIQKIDQFWVQSLGLFLVFFSRNLRHLPTPKGPKIEKIQDRPPGLKFSSEIENLKRAAHQTPNFVENSRGQDSTFQARLKFQARLIISSELYLFQSLGP